jgi:starvation-inducible DNA-binding protein
MKTKLHETKNDLSGKVRRQAINLLNQNLADALDLTSQAQQAHWNVKGPNFIALHELFDKAKEELDEFVDEIAERAVALGGTALGTARVTAKISRMPEYPLNIISGRDHLRALSDAMAAFGRSARSAIDTAAALPDADTSDLFTGVSRGVDKLLWMLEAHLRAKE